MRVFVVVTAMDISAMKLADIMGDLVGTATVQEISVALPTPEQGRWRVSPGASIRELELSVRATNALLSVNPAMTVGELIGMRQLDIISIPGVGARTTREIAKVVANITGG